MKKLIIIILTILTLFETSLLSGDLKVNVSINSSFGRKCDPSIFIYQQRSYPVVVYSKPVSFIEHVPVTTIIYQNPTQPIMMYSPPCVIQRPIIRYYDGYPRYLHVPYVYRPNYSHIRMGLYWGF